MGVQGGSRSGRRLCLSTIIEQVMMNEHRPTMEKQCKVRDMRTKLEVEDESNRRCLCFLSSWVFFVRQLQWRIKKEERIHINLLQEKEGCDFTDRVSHIAGRIKQ